MGVPGCAAPQQTSQIRRDGAARIPLHEAGPAFALANALGGISKKCRVRCGRQQNVLEEDSEVTETTCTGRR